MDPERLRLSGRGAWHTWLEANHASATEAVLVLSKKAVPGGLHYEEALEEALCFGWIDGKLRAHDATTFLLRFSPRKADSIWSESNRERVTRLVREGKVTSAGRATIEAAKANGQWARARRPSRKPRMPSDLGSALRANPTAGRNFRAWGDSFQTSYIFWVMDAKKPETRERRIRRVVERAALNKRPGIEGP